MFWNKEKIKMYGFDFRINETIFSVYRGDKLAMEIHRDDLLHALKKAYEGTPFIFDNMGYAAGEIKSYWVGNVEEK